MSKNYLLHSVQKQNCSFTVPLEDNALPQLIHVPVNSING